MMEEFKENSEGPSFVLPSLETERGEIERVAITFAKNDPQRFIDEFLHRAGSTDLVELTDDILSKLENTDSVDVSKGEWNKVEANAAQTKRPWEKIKAHIESGSPIDAPIIVKVGSTFHLV